MLFATRKGDAMKRFNRQTALWRAGLAALCFSAAASVNAEPIIGLTSFNNLVTFDSAAPGIVSAPLLVTGLVAGDTLLGIDVRPIDGQLIGIARSASDPNQASVYAINSATGVATLIHLPFSFPFSGSLVGGLGIDFNPVPNALRLVSNAEANLRITMGGTGTVNVDGNLTRTGVADDPGLDIAAAAYSNNVPGGIGGVTTLYDIDATTGELFIQGGLNGIPSPNTGALQLVGSLGVQPVSNLIGFDISGLTGTAYASISTALNNNDLYTINLDTGQANLIGVIGTRTRVIDITVAAANSVPEPATLALLSFGFALLALLRRRRA